MMVSLQAKQSTTDQNDDSTFEEDDGRARVLVAESGGYRFAIPVENVREVLRARAVTRVPGAPSTMLGLINVRGMVVSVLELQACVCPAASREMQHAGVVTPASAETGASIVLLEHGSRVVGLSVDTVRDVRPIDECGLTANAALGLGGHFVAGTVTGIESAGGEVVVVLDVAALLTRHLISSAET